MSDPTHKSASILHSSCSCPSSAGVRSYLNNMQMSHPSLSLPGSPRIPPGPLKKSGPAPPVVAQNSIQLHIRLGSRLRPEKWATWAQLGSQDGAQDGQKSSKNRCKNPSKNRCFSRQIFDAILVDFGRENGGKLTP